MPNIKNQYSPSPIYGLGPGFSIADLPAGGDHEGKVALNAVTVATTSSAFALGAHSIEVNLTCTNPAATFDLKILDADNADALLVTKTGLSHGTDLFFGGYEGYDFTGRQLKFRVENISGSGTPAVTVFVRRTS